MNLLKECRDTLYLLVYEKNKRAIKFYIREGFFIEKRQVDEGTGETEVVMRWTNEKRIGNCKMRSGMLFVRQE